MTLDADTRQPRPPWVRSAFDREARDAAIVRVCPPVRGRKRVLPRFRGATLGLAPGLTRRLWRATGGRRRPS